MAYFIALLGPICRFHPGPDFWVVTKMTRVSHPRLRIIPIESPLELLHVDLMGPIPVESIGRKSMPL